VRKSGNEREKKPAQPGEQARPTYAKDELGFVHAGDKPRNGDFEGDEKQERYMG
jgi:hypothetical protein